MIAIEPVDAHDDDALLAWFEPFDASELATWGEHGWLLGELRVLITDRSASLSELAVALDSDSDRNGNATANRRVLGSVWLRMPVRDNTDLVEIKLAVHPEHRRQGVGTALVRYAEERSRQSGRTRIVGDHDEPIGLPAPTPSHAFAEGLGYEAGLAEARRALELPVAEERLDELESAARRFAEAYRLESWMGRCPPAHVAGRIALARSISTDAPQGTLEMEPEVWDRDRFDQYEANAEAMDRERYVTGAVEASTGLLVGVTELSVPRSARRIAYQWDTIVLPEHRGHRLGMLLKVANLRTMQAGSTDTRRVFTWNARENAPMVRVNEEMGFEVVALGEVWQKTLS